MKGECPIFLLWILWSVVSLRDRRLPFVLQLGTTGFVLFWYATVAIAASAGQDNGDTLTLIKIEQLTNRQRKLEEQYRFKEAEKVHAEAVEIAKHSKLPKQYIRRMVATHRTFELLAGMSKDQQTEYLGFGKFEIAAKELDKRGNHQGAFDVHSKGLEILKKLLPEDDIVRIVAEVDVMHLRAKIDSSDNVLRDLSSLKTRCLALVGADNQTFAVLLDAEITVYEKKNDWISVAKTCYELEKVLNSYGNNTKTITGNYQRIALAHLKVGKLDSAWESTQKAIASVEKYEGLEKKELQFWIFVTGGRILMAKEDFPQAETYFRKARVAASVYEEGVLPVEYMRNFRDTYAECLVKLGKREEAEQLKVEGAFP